MSGFIYSIAFKMIGQSAVDKATQAVGRLDSKVDEISGGVNQAARNMDRMGRRGSSAFDKVTKRAASLVSKVALVSATLSSLNTAAQVEGFQNAVNFASGNAAEGAKNIEFINKTVDALGTPLAASFKGFKNLQGGVMGTGITAQQTRDIFWSVSEAASAMTLSADDANGVFLALSQVASKGKVQAEELRGQIGERLPGAFNIAARAMGVSTSQLDKMMERGELLSQDFLPKFGAELHKTFGKGVEAAANSATANFNRFRNSLFRLRDTIGKELLPTVTGLLNQAIIPAVSWISENIRVVGFLTVSLGSLWATVKVYNLTMGVMGIVTKATTAIMAIYNGTTGLSTALTSGFTIATKALNAAMLANPIGFILGLLITLGTATVYAWNQFEGFRGGLTGAWVAIKETAKIVAEFLIQPFMIFGKILEGVFTFDRTKIKSGFEDAANFLQNTVLSAGNRIGNAFLEGYENGVEKFQSSKAKKALSKVNTPDAVSAAFANTPTGQSSNGGGLNSDPSVQSRANGISSGGARTKNIKISIGRLVDKITVQAENVDKGVDEVADMVMKKLLQVVNSANQVQ